MAKKKEKKEKNPRRVSIFNIIYERGVENQRKRERASEWSLDKA